MSPPGTMARVYQALKARVMSGGYAPGERIDPTRLSQELAASATPIREALQRLAGERLVESWNQEGFRQPYVTEAALRDLYQWSDDLLRLLLRSVERRTAETGKATGLGLDHRPPSAVTATIFGWLTASTPNAEYVAASLNLNDRLHAVRLVEDRIFAERDAELFDLPDAIIEGRWPEARRIVAHYHAARMRRVTDIVALLMRREI